MTELAGPLQAPIAVRAPVVLRLRGPGVALSGALAAALLLDLRDPHRTGSYGFCPFRAITGLPCPFCGGLRAGSDLLHGNVAAAVSSNALVVAMAMVAPMVWAAWVWRRWQGTGHEHPPLLGRAGLGVAFGVVSVLFCVLRWLPEFAWLRP